MGEWRWAVSLHVRLLGDGRVAPGSQSSHVYTRRWESGAGQSVFRCVCSVMGEWRWAVSLHVRMLGDGRVAPGSQSSRAYAR
ncbi:hypothetical protein NDU88_008331 [Pleurodeles waltl]|uniref:Uncharacterized protein n=1 Tax=Pleurodeles waltl TaxID=8319 RepID=A0AAV7SVD2_PLEWA|nr:hypothetical protein NDU88_008331 [Pleurodeles waltl]